MDPAGAAAEHVGDARARIRNTRALHGGKKLRDAPPTDK
jgi:hypothetical protein